MDVRADWNATACRAGEVLFLSLIVQYRIDMSENSIKRTFEAWEKIIMGISPQTGGPYQCCQGSSQVWIS